MQAITRTIAGICSVAVVLALVAGCGKPIAATAKPAAKNAIVTVGDMVLIPAGTFVMGNCTEKEELTALEKCVAFVSKMPQPQLLYNWPDELPVHTVMVSAFYMDMFEVTKEKWDEVYNWATNHGYAFDNPGKGKAPYYPVHHVTWFDCVKWCNARSEKEGLTRCYYRDGGKTNIYRPDPIGPFDSDDPPGLDNECVDWNANGYRLPTEAEWEKAARGGVQGQRFPWSDSDQIQHARANYASTNMYRCDTSPTRGYHPMFNDKEGPFTGPVGYFAPNGYGLYDMAGNVQEECWDVYDEDYYAISPSTNPHGPARGTCRVGRSGGWGGSADDARCANRGGASPGTIGGSSGFRCVRGL